MSNSQIDLLEAFLSLQRGDSQQLPTHFSTFTGRTYEELIEFLASGKSVDIDTFDDVGLKSLAELHEEYTGRDLVLAMDSNGNIYRQAKSSKVRVTVPSAGIRYREIGRKFIRKKRYLKHPKPRWEAVSETGKRDETPLESALCGIGEELGWDVPTDNLVCLTLGNPKVDEHNSSVYPGIRSVNLLTRFSLELPEPLWRGERKIIKDGNIEVHIGEFPYDPE